MTFSGHVSVERDVWRLESATQCVLLNWALNRDLAREEFCHDAQVPLGQASLLRSPEAARNTKSECSSQLGSRSRPSPRGTTSNFSQASRLISRPRGIQIWPRGYLSRVSRPPLSAKRHPVDCWREMGWPGKFPPLLNTLTHKNTHNSIPLAQEFSKASIYSFNLSKVCKILLLIFLLVKSLYDFEHIDRLIFDFGG